MIPEGEVDFFMDHAHHPWLSLYSTTVLYDIVLLYYMIISKHAQLLIGGKSVSQQYTSYSLIFSPLHSIINKEQHKKLLCNQASYYGKYGMFNCQSISSLPAVHTLYVTFQVNNNVRSTPASTALTQEVITCVP